MSKPLLSANTQFSPRFLCRVEGYSRPVWEMACILTLNKADSSASFGMVIEPLGSIISWSHSIDDIAVDHAATTMPRGNLEGYSMLDSELWSTQYAPSDYITTRPDVHRLSSDVGVTGLNGSDLSGRLRGRRGALQAAGKSLLYQKAQPIQPQSQHRRGKSLKAVSMSKHNYCRCSIAMFWPSAHSGTILHGRAPGMAPRWDFLLHVAILEAVKSRQKGPSLDQKQQQTAARVGGRILRLSG